MEAVQEDEEHQAAVEAGVAGKGEAAREGESQGHPVALDQPLQTGASPKLSLRLSSAEATRMEVVLASPSCSFATCPMLTPSPTSLASLRTVATKACHPLASS